jgi:hypothetical protein
LVCHIVNGVAAVLPQDWLNGCTSDVHYGIESGAMIAAPDLNRCGGRAPEARGSALLAEPAKKLTKWSD